MTSNAIEITAIQPAVARIDERVGIALPTGLVIHLDLFRWAVKNPSVLDETPEVYPSQIHPTLFGLESTGASDGRIVIVPIVPGGTQVHTARRVAARHMVGIPAFGR